MSFYATKKGEEVMELLHLALKYYDIEKKDLLAKVDSNVTKPLPLIPQPERRKYTVGTSTLGQYASYWFKTKDYGSSEKDITSSSALSARREEIIKQIDKWVADCKEVYEKNLPIIEHNKAVAEKITKLMQAIGIPNTYTESYFKSSRSTKKTAETKKAGYLSDIDRNVKTSQLSVPDGESLKRDMQREYDELASKIYQEENKKELERKKQEEIHQVALLRAKYTPDNALSNAYDVRDVILSKDKYLHLAYWLERNRGDRNDGYYYAETVLNGFTIEEGNTVDQEVYDCIEGCIRSGDDGGIFRDCEYNYGVLYGMVKDATLLEDLQKVNEWGGFDD